MNKKGVEKIYTLGELTSNDILNRYDFEDGEFEFLQYYTNLVKQEMMNELMKRIGNLAFFQNVNININ